MALLNPHHLGGDILPMNREEPDFLGMLSLHLQYKEIDWGHSWISSLLLEQKGVDNIFVLYIKLLAFTSAALCKILNLNLCKMLVLQHK